VIDLGWDSHREFSVDGFLASGDRFR